MVEGKLQSIGNHKDLDLLPNSGLGFLWFPQIDNTHLGGLFASVTQMGIGLGISPNTPISNQTLIKFPSPIIFAKNTLQEPGLPIAILPQLLEDEETWETCEERLIRNKKKNLGFRLKFKIGNESLRRLVSGAIAGVVSRTTVAPLETIRTHLMVGTCGNSMGGVFKDIMENEGWKGLYRGNLVNVIRVAPSKAIELFMYDTVTKHITPKPGEQPKICIPAAPIAGAVAGMSATLCTYPLELLKTRLTVQRGVYKNIMDAFLKIIHEEGPAELYRGLTPSLIGVIPYAATNYFAYDSLRKAYKKVFKNDEIGNIATLLIGSASGTISSCMTFPLEIARKHMQAGALNGRQYKNMLHALISILENEGVSGLYRGLGPSCIKIVPAAGISFMCYEACKKILIENDSWNKER